LLEAVRRRRQAAGEPRRGEPNVWCAVGQGAGREYLRRIGEATTDAL